jgi:hypothetical protein
MIVALAGCGRQPEAAQLRADAARLHPDCRVMDIDPGEGDSDTVYIHLRLDCTGAPQERRRVLGYMRNASGWHLFFDDRDEPPVPVASGRATVPGHAKQ